MTKITRYLFGNEVAQTITTRTLDGEHWYMAFDICSLLQMSNYSQAVQKHLDEDEFRKDTIYIGGRHGKKNVLLINNTGMLKLIIKGRSERAEQVRTLAKSIPSHLKISPWPEELTNQ